MIDFLYFLLKVSGIFSILYLVYFSCFSGLTFHKLNRAYLLAMLPLSLILPILKIEFAPYIPTSKSLPLLFDNFVNVENNVIQAGSVNHFGLNFGILFFIIYSLVVLIFLTIMLLNIFMLVKIKRRSAIQTNGCFSVINAKISSTFSFFYWIFLPQNTNNALSEQIIEHEKLHGKSHHTFDFVAKTGTPVMATANGIVTRVVFLENSYGKLVEIDHGDNFVTRYAQLNNYVVNVGDKVKKGDLIAYVGQSGLSTGPHLHYEVIINGENVDPKNYIKE